MKIYFCLLAFILSGCSFLESKHSFDQNADFSNYNTYVWMQGVKKTTAFEQSAEQVSAEDEKKIRALIDAELQRKQFQKLDSSKADLIAAFHTVINEHVNADTHYNVHYDRYGYARPTSMKVTTYSYRHGTLLLDFIDANNKQIVWSGSVGGFLDMYKDPNKQQKRLESAIAKLLDPFPPN